MIFKFHSAFALGLIAMVAGTYLISKASPESACCKTIAKIIGVLVIVTAFAGLICTTYHGISYGKQGAYEYGKMGRGRHMKHNCPLMEKSLKEKLEHPATE